MKHVRDLKGFPKERESNDDMVGFNAILKVIGSLELPEQLERLDYDSVFECMKQVKLRDGDVTQYQGVKNYAKAVCSKFGQSSPAVAKAPKTVDVGKILRVIRAEHTKNMNLGFGKRLTDEQMDDIVATAIKDAIEKGEV